MTFGDPPIDTPKFTLPAPTPGAKVVKFDFKTRQAVRPEEPIVPVTVIEDIAEPVFEPDPVFIASIEAFLIKAKTGEIKGIIAMSWLENLQGFMRLSYMGDSSDNIMKEHLLYLGGMKVLADDISASVYEMTLPPEDMDEQ